MPQDGGELHHDDLAWARALAANEAEALARYERELVPVIDAQLRRRNHTADEIADLQQTLRARLFVGDGDGPKIVGYSGTGRLRSWVLVIALREAVRARQAKVREPAKMRRGATSISEVACQLHDAGQKGSFQRLPRDGCRWLHGLAIPQAGRLHVGALSGG